MTSASTSSSATAGSALFFRPVVRSVDLFGFPHHRSIRSECSP
ncbi:hypothetical protein M6B38_134080 [Iris pallida]|uniref:Uncharacterized protein n=1 Tax=Iris pallida TaxID=29817 RepID=A0AAX6FGT4_IRIPA|nr:hypothetical protein M6B38_134080 [Iris pallida]